MKKSKSLIIVLVIIAAIVLALIGSYNGLIRMDEDVNKAWSQVEVNYQRRADLIPNLVNVVKGYAKHESDTFENLAKMRSGYQEAKTPADYEKLDQELTKSINVVVENYPELKANENFLSLQDEISGTENRIAFARKDYNESANKFNKSIRMFPRSILANMMGFSSRDLFQAKAGAENAPEVDFN